MFSIAKIREQGGKYWNPCLKFELLEWWEDGELFVQLRLVQVDLLHVYRAAMFVSVPVTLSRTTPDY